MFAHTVRGLAAIAKANERDLTGVNGEMIYESDLFNLIIPNASHSNCPTEQRQVVRRIVGTARELCLKTMRHFERRGA